MNCPECKADTSVVDSRSINEGLGVRRRRACKSCGCRFSTEETLVVIGRKRVQPEPSQQVVEASPAPKPKPVKKFSVQKAANARRKIEDLRDMYYDDEPWDYIPEKW